MNAFEFMLRNWREVLGLTAEHLLLVAVSTLKCGKRPAS